MKSVEIKPYNLPNDRILVSKIDAKPKYLYGLIIIFGVISVFDDAARIYGIVLICFAAFSLFFMPAVSMIEFYKDYLVLYNKADKNNCFIAYYDEIDTWWYSWSPKRDFLHIELTDGSEIKIEAFSKPIFEARMNQFLKDKRKKKQ